MKTRPSIPDDHDSLVDIWPRSVRALGDEGSYPDDDLKTVLVEGR